MLPFLSRACVRLSSFFDVCCVPCAMGRFETLAHCQCYSRLFIVQVAGRVENLPHRAVLGEPR